MKELGVKTLIKGHQYEYGCYKRVVIDGREIIVVFSSFAPIGGGNYYYKDLVGCRAMVKVMEGKKEVVYF